MKQLSAVITLLVALSVSGSAQTGERELVNVRELIPDIVIDLKYNTTDNFTHEKLYSTDECLLLAGAVRRLAVVQDSLRRRRLGLKVWDGYRPRTIQFLMFDIYPDSNFVADPKRGSLHNRGAAVDLTLVDLVTGRELRMPTPFDFFGEAASQGSPNLPPDVIANRELLQRLMVDVGGFESYEAEWWHYVYPPGRRFPLCDFQMR